MPVLLPQLEAQPEDLADSTQILHSIESRFPSRPLWPADFEESKLRLGCSNTGPDESIGIATRFVYYEFRAGAGKQIDPSVLSQLAMQLARRQFGINPFAEAKLAPVTPECCFKPVAPSLAGCGLCGRRFLERGRYCCCRPAESFSVDSSIPS